MSWILSVEDVRQVIEQAKTSGTDPARVVIGLFEGLGDSASVTGAVLAQGLQESGIALALEAQNILAGIMTIEKSGDQLQLVLRSTLQPTVRGTELRLGPTVSAVIQKFPDGTALAEITGIAVNKFIWIEIQRLQFHDNAGKRSVRVDTNFGGREFVLP